MKAQIKTESEVFKKLEQSFLKHFSNDDGVKYFSSPTSIILLGDHTQYNDGLMISVSFNCYVGVALRKSDKGYSVVYDNKMYSSHSLSKFDFPAEESLLKSLNNLFKQIEDEKIITSGFECCIVNETSKTFGLGNHAAITMGFLKAMDSVFDTNLSNQKLVDLAVESEKKLYGKVVSKPLYYSSLAHRENTLMYYDTRSDFHQFLPIDDKVQFVVCKTNIEKKNFHQTCKERIEECEIGVKGLRLYIWGIKNLRDVEEKFLERHIHMLPKRLYSRCFYNVLARKIVEESYKNLKNNDCEEFARKLNETHSGLAEHYEISSQTMNELVKLADESKLCLGSKMISCSYNDSTINLVYKKNIDKFDTFMKKNFSLNNGTKLDIENYSISDGAKQFKAVRKSAAN